MRTWSTWSDQAAIDEISVVSLIGEQWSPNTPPPSTALTTNGTDTDAPSRFMEAASGSASGTMTANVPQLVPVAKAMVPAVRNTTGATRSGVKWGVT